MTFTWPNSRLTDLLKIEHPIIQAPMAGAATPQMAAAVAHAGGLGSIGCGVKSCDEVVAVSAELRRLTNAPFHLNFFMLPAQPALSPAQYEAVKTGLQPYYDQFGITDIPDNPSPTPASFDADMLATVLDIRPGVVSFHFGMPGRDTIASLKQAAIILLSTATNVAEARALEAAGMDAIIAQGWEAGGHRGSHIPGGPSDGVGSLSLIPQVVDATNLPVIAAGGIADGRGIAAALALGASGVQIGTAFLTCPEAATSARHRELIQTAGDQGTMFTDAVSGRAARGGKSQYAIDMADMTGRLAPFPSMYALSGPIRAAAESARPEPVSFYLFGQSAALNRRLGAGELVDKLVSETAEVLAGMSACQADRP